MSRLRHTDILVELIELCQEHMVQLRHQLGYYRASVYKGEAKTDIETSVLELRTIARLFDDEEAREAFRDFDAMSEKGALTLVPGECLLSLRVGRLLAQLDGCVGQLHRTAYVRTADQSLEIEFTNTVKEHRDALLAMCRQGSRHWAFFQAL